MNIFSEELRILDRNTVKYMIDDLQSKNDNMQTVIDEMKAVIIELRALISELRTEIADKDAIIAKLMAEKEA